MATAVAKATTDFDVTAVNESHKRITCSGISRKVLLDHGELNSLRPHNMLHSTLTERAHDLALSLRGTCPCRRQNRRVSAVRPSLDMLEQRLALTASPVGLGAAAQFAVLGLKNTTITNLVSTIAGDVGVSRGGDLWNPFGSRVTGDVVESARNQASGSGKLYGKVSVDPSTLAQADSAALSASILNAALTPTQHFGNITRSTTIVGGGGLNVVSIDGSIRSSLTLSGSASDVFVVNVSGNMALMGDASLGLSGGVTADHVLYNFTSSRSVVSVVTTGSVNGTLLAPHGDVILSATCNGEVVAGGGDLLLVGAWINPVTFQPTAAQAASLSGGVASQGVGLAGIVITLIGTDSKGNPVNLTTTTDSNGNFTFNDLPSGTYTLKAPVVAGYTTNSFGGKVNNQYDGNVLLNGDIAGIVLGANDQGSAYYFSELPTDSLDG